jgi:hypothetical protein
MGKCITRGRVVGSARLSALGFCLFSSLATHHSHFPEVGQGRGKTISSIIPPQPKARGSMGWTLGPYS